MAAPKINLIRKAVNKDDKVKELEKQVKGLLKKSLSHVKYITVYNNFRSVDYSMKDLDNYNEKNTSGNQLITLDNYKALALTITMNTYKKYDANSWKVMVSKWRNSSGN